MERTADATEQFRALVEQVPVVTYTESLGDTGTYTYFSPQIKTLLGFTPQELVDRPRAFHALIHPDDRAAVQEEGERTSATGEPFHMEYRVQTRDGRWLRVRDEATLVRNSSGRPHHWQGVIVDVTEQREAEAALRESEERFRAAFDHAPIGLAVVTPDGRFRQVNRSLCELTGYPEAELLKLTFQEITHPDDLEDNLELVQRLWRGEVDSYQIETRYVRKDGHPVWVELTSTAVRDADGPRYAISQIQDVTGRRNLDLERATMLASERAYTKQLHELAALREDLSKMVAHELRSPVAALRMMATTLASGALPADAAAEMVSAMQAQIDQLDRLINDVTAAAAAEREDFSIQLHPVPLSILLAGAASFARSALGDRPVSTGSIPDLQVWCDPERISQVLQNLLDNIGKHTPPGTTVEIRAVARGNRVRIEIADRGPGIPASDLPLIFEKFGRGRAAFDRQRPGLGLGLYLSRRIVEAHGSELTVQSTPDHGSIFRFDLRVVR